MSKIADLHAASIAAIESKRFCTVADAATYLGRHRQAVYQLVREQKIASVYQGGRRMVVVKDLIRFGDGLPIDPPEAS